MFKLLILGLSLVGLFFVTTTVKGGYMWSNGLHYENHMIAYAWIPVALVVYVMTRLKWSK